MMKRAAILALLPVLGACTPMGPRALQATRPLYNEAVANTNDQELLLNLVRIRYRDTTYFTTVERIAASLELNMSIGASGTYSNTASTAAKNTVGRILNVGPGSIALNEKPTIFYAPIEGEKFVRQMMTPMNADVLLLLVRSGWSIDRVLTLGVIEMNGLKNAPTASGPAPSREPEYKDFIEAVHLLRMLQRENKLDLSKSGEKGGLELRFIRGSAASPQAARFKALAGVAADADRIRIEVGAQPSDDHALALTTRPVMAALNYLATGVDVPAADMAAGKVRQTVHADGTPFNWQEMLDGVFRVRVAAKEPEDASTKIQYRGSWFYIADDDLDAKSTFVLLTQIIALHSVSPTTVAPLISIGK